MTKRRFGSIRKLPSGRWQATTATDRKRITAPRTFRAKLDAEAWLTDRRREIDGDCGTRTQYSLGLTLFAAYAARWLANRELRPKTRQGYERIHTAHLMPTFGGQHVADITPADVRDWHRVLPGKPAMRASAYAVLRAILSTALADELITVDPAGSAAPARPSGSTRSGPPPWPSSTRSPQRCPTG